MSSPNTTEGRDSQRPSGNSSCDARNKTNEKAIRLSINHMKKYKLRTDSKAIYLAMIEKFGVSSKEVKDITAIGQDVDQT